ncbi:MAG: helix-turn-helix transcriptional regulator [Anaerolineae bacterium]|nr:helix-turn-helix transcriptional regulator [Anaerolineae bacterium]
MMDENPRMSAQEAAQRRMDQMRKGTTTLAILKLFVDTDAPMHGYQIIQALEARSQGMFQFKEGLIYPRLHGMEKKGLLQSCWEGEPGTRRRKVYQITERGRRQLQLELQQWETFWQGMNLLLGMEQTPSS